MLSRLRRDVRACSANAFTETLVRRRRRLASRVTVICCAKVRARTLRRVPSCRRGHPRERLPPASNDCHMQRARAHRTCPPPCARARAFVREICMMYTQSWPVRCLCHRPRPTDVTVAANCARVGLLGTRRAIHSS